MMFVLERQAKAATHGAWYYLGRLDADDAESVLKKYRSMLPAGQTDAYELRARLSRDQVTADGLIT